MDYYNQKVLWSEGMLLTPHHFQQADRYMETLLRRRLRGVRAQDWGVCSLQLDSTALSGGAFGLSGASGVMPDGTWFDAPGLDALPATRPVEPHYPTGASSLDVYLAIPTYTPGQVACLPPGSSAAAGVSTPFEGKTATIRDETDASREREILVAARRLRLVFQGEPLEGASCLHIARLRRTASGAFEVDPEFIPACQYFSASTRLTAILGRTIDLLVSKNAELGNQGAEYDEGLVYFAEAHRRTLWSLLETVNRHIPALRSLHHLGDAHPFDLHRELAALVGALCTFSDVDPRDVPVYDHADASTAFNGLERMLTRLLGVKIEPSEAPVPVEVSSPTFAEVATQQVRDSLFAAQLDGDERLLTGSRLVLAVGADLPLDTIRDTLPDKVKVTSAERVDMLIARAMRGLSVQHMADPPPELPNVPGRVYFEVVKEGPHWEAITSGKTIAVYVPRDFTRFRLDLFAVFEE